MDRLIPEHNDEEYENLMLDLKDKENEIISLENEIYILENRLEVLEERIEEMEDK